LHGHTIEESLATLPASALEAIVADVPVRLMKRDLLFIAEQMLPRVPFLEVS
jgi:hypothetical protein